MTTVLLFAGSTYYPRNHLEDLVGTLAQMPSTAEVAAWVSRFMDSEARFELQTNTIEWVTALSVVASGPTPTLSRLAWTCLHGNDPARMRREGYAHIWQGADGDWHAVKEADADDLEGFADAPLAWPVSPVDTFESRDAAPI
jgi:hypothetical protein